MSRRNLFVALGATVVVIVVAWWIWRGREPQAFQASAAPTELAKFVTSPKIDQLPDDRRLALMDTLRDDKEKLAEAYAKKQLSTPEYETVLINIWISRALKHSTDFAKVPVGAQRSVFLDRIVEKGEKKRLETPRPAGSTIWDKDPYELDAVKRQVATWPAERQAQWEDFRKALRARQVEKRVAAVSGVWY